MRLADEFKGSSELKTRGILATRLRGGLWKELKCESCPTFDKFCPHHLDR